MQLSQPIHPHGHSRPTDGKNSDSGSTSPAAGTTIQSTFPKAEVRITRHLSHGPGAGESSSAASSLMGVGRSLHTVEERVMWEWVR